MANPYITINRALNDQPISEHEKTLLYLWDNSDTEDLQLQLAILQKLILLMRDRLQRVEAQAAGSAACLGFHGLDV